MFGMLMSWAQVHGLAMLLIDGPLRGLDEGTAYGFFSPKFCRKTQLTAEQVRAEVRAGGADVTLFSPQPDMGAFFLNVFEQGETFDPGFIDAYQAFLDHLGWQVPLRQLVMDSRQSVFSNYFVARPAFWRAWLALNERFFAVCEGTEPAPAAVRDALVCPTTYPGDAQRKVFLQERAASLLLATDARWKTHAVDPFPMAWSASRLREHPHEAFMSDALKLAFREQGFPEYLQAFAKLRQVFQAPR